MMQNSDIFGAIGLSIGFVLLYLIFVFGIVYLAILYIKTLIDAMIYVRPSNRLIGATNILYTFIPLVGLVYGFIVYPKISDSIKQEYATLGLPSEGDFGRGLGIALQACTVCCIIPILNFLAFFGVLVLIIIYGVKINGYKVRLMQANANDFKESGSISNSTDILD